MEYVTMIPTEVFDCFAQGDYIPLMAQAAMEHALSPRVVDQLFEETADRQYTRDLPFLFGCWADELGRLPDPTLDQCRLPEERRPH